MSFLKISPFNRGKARETPLHSTDLASQPTLSLHVPAFGGMVMKPVSLLPGAVNDDTVLTGQLEVDLPASYEDGMLCGGVSVWIEKRWTDLEGQREKGNIVCYNQQAVVESGSGQGIWLRPGTQR